MLKLKRNINQSIVIGGNVRVTVLEVDRQFDQITLGIEAPREIPVDREEVHHRKLADQDKTTGSGYFFKSDEEVNGNK